MREFGWCRLLVAVVLAVGALTIPSLKASSASWNGIEPFKSRRADVERILGKAASEGPDGILHFNVAGGTVTVAFVGADFVASKKLRPELEGTVLQIILQHEKSSDTPESLGLTTNHKFVAENVQNATIFRNLKEGIIYTFVDGRLKTTRFTFSDAQLGHVLKTLR